MPFLQFKGKTAVETYHNSLPHHALELDADLSILDNGEQPSLSGNLIIEGDNLLALKALLPTHAGKIKCVYIDPPYNTGNEGWVYNDNLTQPQFKEWIGQVVGNDESDPSRHDKWCCMMYPRLSLLKELLSKDGVIVISIDDNEVHHLRMIMDQLFGEANFLACVVWQKKYAPANDATDFSWTHDYLLVYSNNSDYDQNGKAVSIIARRERSEEQKKLYKNPDDDARGPWVSGDYLGSKTPKQRPNLFYAIKHPKTGKDVWPANGLTWRYSKEKHELHIKEKRIWWGSNQENDVPRYKRFLTEVRDIVSSTWWPHQQFGHNDEARKELKALLGTLADGTTPKPVRLITEILKLVSPADENNEDYILDCFAGTGTSAHAVLQLNKDDGSNRRFIVVQLPYDTKTDEATHRNIARDITRERLKRVVEGHGNSPAIEGSFVYARLSKKPILGDYRDLGDTLPSYEEIARYIFFTETSSHWDEGAVDRETGRIGEHKGSAYYLLYTPNGEEDGVLDRDFLKNVAAQEKGSKLVVYCEKFWMHRDEMREWEAKHGKTVRHMLVPFNLK